MKKLFTSRQIAMTPGMQEFAVKYNVDIYHYINRHFSGDFGDHGKYENIVLTTQEIKDRMVTTSDDGKLNKIGVMTKGRVISFYTIDTPGGTQQFRIITDHGHEVTTCLLPSEY